MKAILAGLVLLGSAMSFAATSAECLGGNYAACRHVINKYGSQTNHRGAIDLFNSICSSQKLQVACRITSTKKSDTLKKTLEFAERDGGMFVENGPQIDKIYQISEIK